MEGKALLRAIDIANLLRDVGNHEHVNDLVAGNPGRPSSCVLANTFNCNCLVRNGAAIRDDRYNSKSEQHWFAYFEGKEYADALAKELDETTYKAKITHSGLRSHEDEAPDGWAVALPTDVGRIAEAFDAGDLAAKYYIGYEPSDKSPNEQNEEELY